MTRSPSLEGLSVVLVDDDPAELSALAGALEGAGATVAAFESGAAAISALAEGLVPHVLVADLHMRGLDGCQLTRFVRSTDFPSFATAPVLIVSSTFKGPDVEALAVSAGAKAFLPLPAPPGRLCRYVAQLAAGETPRPDRAAVLFVEDRSVLTPLVTTLEAKGSEVIIGHAGASVDECRHADWVVWDATLPDDDLHDLLEATRCDMRRSAVVVLADDAAPLARLAYLEAGADAVVPRQAHPDLLSEVLDELARQRSFLRVEEALRARTTALSSAERRYERLFHAIPEMVLVIDDTGTIVSANESARHLLGDDVAGSPAGEIMGRVAAPALALNPGGFPLLVGGELKTAGGHRRHVEATYQALEASAGHVLAVVRDVTDRVEAERRQRDFEAKLHQGQKLESLGVMASGIAHDFNNLLLSILGNANLAADDLEEGHPALGFVRHVAVAAERAAELTGQILAYSGQAERTETAVDLQSLVAELSRLLEPAVSKKARLTFDAREEPLWVRGDPAQIRQVLMNLIVNASDAREGRAGEIVVRSSKEVLGGDEVLSWGGDPPEPGEYVRIEVADTGVGMTPDIRARIFDPFFTTKFTGRGLGLAATVGIVRAHGGAVRVETEDGRGTCFFVYLPATGEPPPEATVQKGAGEDRSAGPTGRVLVVEDEPAVRQLVTQILRRSGFDVLEAGDGKEAVDLVRSHAGAIDAVLLDRIMPVMDGKEALRRIRQLYPEVPIVMTSGNLTRWDDGSDDGANAYLQKPYRPEELKSVLTAVLAHPAAPLPAGRE